MASATKARRLRRAPHAGMGSNPRTERQTPSPSAQVSLLLFAAWTAPLPPISQPPCGLCHTQPHKVKELRNATLRIQSLSDIVTRRLWRTHQRWRQRPRHTMSFNTTIGLLCRRHRTGGGCVERRSRGLERTVRGHTWRLGRNMTNSFTNWTKRAPRIEKRGRLSSTL